VSPRVSLTEGEYKTRPYKAILVRCSRMLPGSGVSPEPLFSPPKNGGTRGLKLNMETLAADFAPLYPPCNWIPAFAGMTDYARITGKLRFVRAAYRGVQRGEAPLRSLFSPKYGGLRGLMKRHETASCVERIRSRFRSGRAGIGPAR
jgi:hypothetical protein